MSYGWVEIGRTQLKKNMHGEFHAILYKYTNDAYSNYTNLKLFSDFKLIRGDSGKREKVAGFILTHITFSLGDKNANISTIMIDSDGGEFKSVIYKDGVVFFVGSLVMTTAQKELRKTNPVISLKVYDGISRLKQFSNFSELPTSRVRVTEILRGILNKLDFSLDIKIYQDIYQGTDSGANPAGTIRPVATTYVRVKDYLLVNPDATFHDILSMIIEQFQWEVFEKDGSWIARQITSMHYTTTIGVRETIVAYADGSLSGGSAVNLNQSLEFGSLAEKPTSFKWNKLSKVKVLSECYNPKTLPKIFNDTLSTIWSNGDFRLGATGWTVGAGIPEYIDGGVILPAAASIYQETSALVANQGLRIKLNALRTRMILNYSQTVVAAYEHALIKITYHTSGSIYYYRVTDGTWHTSSVNGTFVYGVKLYGVYETVGVFLEEYDSGMVNEDIKLNVPNEIGVLRITLTGGVADSGNNYPLEMVQHRECSVELEIEQSSDAVNPTQYTLSAEVDSQFLRIKNIEIPFSDLAPFNVNFWHSVWDDNAGILNYFKTQNWETDLGVISLFDYHARKMLALHQNNHGLNLELLPGSNVDYNNIIYGNMDGEGIRYYLPCYEEVELVNDRKKIVLLEHKFATISPSVTDGYVIGGGGASKSTQQTFFMAPTSTIGNSIVDYQHKPTYNFTFSNFSLSAILFELLENYIIDEIEIFVVTAFDADATIQVNVGVNMVVPPTKIKITSKGRKAVRPPKWNKATSKQDVKIFLSGTPTVGEMVVIIKVREVEYLTEYEVF